MLMIRCSQFFIHFQGGYAKDSQITQSSSFVSFGNIVSLLMYKIYTQQKNLSHRAIRRIKLNMPSKGLRRRFSTQQQSVMLASPGSCQVRLFFEKELCLAFEHLSGLLMNHLYVVLFSFWGIVLCLSFFFFLMWPSLS